MSCLRSFDRRFVGRGRHRIAAVVADLGRTVDVVTDLGSSVAAGTDPRSFVAVGTDLGSSSGGEGGEGDIHEK